MNHDIQASSPQQAVARVEPSTAELIQAALTNPNIEPSRLNAFLEFKLRVDSIEAEKEFNRDFAAALSEMPRVKKNGTIDMGEKGAMAFAKYEDIDAAIRPVESKYGFARSFATSPCADGIQMTVHLKHRSGHSETSTLLMPPDTGHGRNGMQARGSASSYAKRYLTLDKWNIVTEGKDNDAATAECISKVQAHAINDLIYELGMDAEGKERFLRFAGAKTVAQIQKQEFDRCVKALEQKRRGKA